MKHIISIILFLSVNCVLSYSQVDSVYYGMPYENLTEILNGFVNEGINYSAVKSAEDADRYSEGLLYAAADIAYEESNFTENLNSLAYALLSLSIKKQYLLDDDLRYAINLEDISVYLNLLGYYNEALAYNLSAYKILSRRYKETEYYPDILIRLATSYCKLGLYDDAISYQQKAASVYKSMPGSEYEYGWALYNVGDLMYESGNLNGSIDYLKQALDVIKNNGGFQHLNDADEFLKTITLAFIMQGNYEESLGYCEVRVALSKHLYGEESLEYSNALSNFATCLSFQGQYDKACQLFKQSVEIIACSPDCKYDLAITCDQYAKTLISTFKLTEAKKYLFLSKSLFEELNMNDTYDYATLLQTMADYYDYLGIYDQSYLYETQAHSIIMKNCRELSPEYILSCRRLAASEKNNNNFSNALNIYKAVLPIQLKLSGKEEGYIKTLLSIAEIYNKLSDYKQAYSYMEEAITLLSNISSSYELSCVCRQLGDLFNEMKDYSSACSYYNRSLEVTKNSKVGSIYDSFYSMVGLSMSLLFSGDTEKSIQVARDINSIYDEVSANINSMDYAERYHFWKQFVMWSMDYYPYIVSRIPQKEQVIELFNIQLKYKNYLLRNDIYNKDVEDYVKNNSTIKNCKDLFAGFENFSDELNKVLKKQLDGQSSTQNSKRETVISLETLRATLSPKDVAIEFIEVPEINQSRAIYALLLKKSYDSPKFLRLCNVDELPVLPYFSNYPTNKQLIEYEEYYKKLYEKIWYPLESEIASSKNIYFSPSLNLVQVGVEYAIYDKESLYDKYNVIRLSSIGVASDYSPKIQYTNSLLVGGLNMGSSSQTSNYFSDISSSTYAEVSSISDILKTRNNTVTQIISGDNGVESVFKEYFSNSNCQYVDLLHIATHGFWWSKRDITKQFRVDIKDENSCFVSSDPNHALYRSGVALSNANLAINALLNYDDKIDGILTSIEAKDLDLLNVKLLTLSACQTGLGDLTPVGIYGLQRGFKIAGVNKIMMSLWEVETNATKMLMTEFYKNIAKGRPCHESLRIAQSKLRKTEIYDNPYYWAAFIMLD